MKPREAGVGAGFGVPAETWETGGVRVTEERTGRGTEERIGPETAPEARRSSWELAEQQKGFIAG